MAGDRFYLYDNIMVARDLEPVAEIGSGKLGALAYYEHETYGPQVYRRIKNSDGAALAIGETAMIKAGQTDPYVAEDGAVGTPNARVLGVAQVSIPDGYYGWVLKEGKGLIISNGSTTTHAGQKLVAAGQVADATIGTDDICIFALAANASAGTTSLALMRVP